MNLFKRMNLDSVVGKNPPAKKVSKRKKAVRAKKPKASKKASAPRVAVDVYREVPEENCFWVFDGPNLRSLSDLCEVLPQMTDEQFDHHTKRDGNDFAKWIGEVLQEEELAKKVTRLKTRKSIVTAIRKVS